ncbi:MAG: hypothetical protein M1831_003876 [Alyxoria varia]|nr:MAG: hypothetical protein M1831_003876 [Alyxoria varia]
MKLSAGVISLFLAAASVAVATEPHANVKRSANAFAEALAQPEPNPEPVAEAWRRYCHWRGQACGKVKRAIVEAEEN